MEACVYIFKDYAGQLKYEFKCDIGFITFKVAILKVLLLIPDSFVGPQCFVSVTLEWDTPPFRNSESNHILIDNWVVYLVYLSEVSQSAPTDKGFSNGEKKVRH